MCLQSSVDQKLKGMSKKTKEKIILNPITNVSLALLEFQDYDRDSQKQGSLRYGNKHYYF
jgi:hypothetical protein